MKTDESRWKSITINDSNDNQCQSMTINDNQCQSMKINENQ